MTKAMDEMVIDHPHCLHIGIADDGADEGKSSFFQLPAQAGRKRGGSRYV